MYAPNNHYFWSGSCDDVWIVLCDGNAKHPNGVFEILDGGIDWCIHGDCGKYRKT